AGEKSPVEVILTNPDPMNTVLILPSKFQYKKFLFILIGLSLVIWKVPILFSPSSIISCPGDDANVKSSSSLLLLYKPTATTGLFESWLEPFMYLKIILLSSGNL